MTENSRGGELPRASAVVSAAGLVGVAAITAITGAVADRWIPPIQESRRERTSH